MSGTGPNKKVGRMRETEEGTEETRAWSTNPRTSTNDETGIDVMWRCDGNSISIKAKVLMAGLETDLR